MISIDKEKCVGCGSCVSVCPFTVLALDEDAKADHTGKNCIKCMHCGAICPAAAISYDGLPAVCEEVIEISETMERDMELLVRQRRSYRKFQKKKVEREEICNVLAAADYAPSAKNQHPVHWIVVENTSVIEKLHQVILNYCQENHVLGEVVAEYENGNDPVLGENSSILIGYCMDGAINPGGDTMIALTNVDLLLQSRGIGTFFGGYLVRFLNMVPACRSFVGLPDGAQVYGTLLFGYPKQPPYRYVPKRLDPSEVKFV